MSFALKHNTTGVLMADLLKLLKLVSAGKSAIPSSKYFLDKPLTGMIDQFECHHYCSVCTSYLGMPQAQDETLTCVKCHFSISVEKSLHDRNYFLSIPLTYQIQDILENQGMHDICFHASGSNRFGINDMYDGTLYQMLRSDSEEDFLTLL